MDIQVISINDSSMIDGTRYLRFTFKGMFPYGSLTVSTLVLKHSVLTWGEGGGGVGSCDEFTSPRLEQNSGYRHSLTSNEEPAVRYSLQVNFSTFAASCAEMFHDSPSSEKHI